MNPLVISQLLSLISAGLTVSMQIQQAGQVIAKMQAEGRTEPTAEEWAALDASKKAAADALAAHIAALG